MNVPVDQAGANESARGIDDFLEFPFHLRENRMDVAILDLDILIGIAPSGFDIDDRRI